MIKSARRKILLVDSSKFTTPAFCTFGDLAAFDHLITDDGIGPDVLEGLRKIGIEVTVVPTG